MPWPGTPTPDQAAQIPTAADNERALWVERVASL